MAHLRNPPSTQDRNADEISLLDWSYVDPSSQAVPFDPNSHDGQEELYERTNLHTPPQHSHATTKVPMVVKVEPDPSSAFLQKYHHFAQQKRPSSRESWVHKIELLSFCLVFALLIGGLFVVRKKAITENGFQVDPSTSSYTWTYAPTAVFVVIIAFWRHVDYRCKVQAPWIEMKKTFGSPQKTLLLDYVSPLLPISVFKSLANTHFEVTSSITVFGMLKLAILLSTGLLIFRPTVLIEKNMIVQLDIGGVPTGGNIQILYNNAAAMAMSYYGSLERGLQYPPRTGPASAFQELSSENHFPANSTVTAEVWGFFPWLECETTRLNQTFSRTTYNATIAKRDEETSYTIDSTFQTANCNGYAPTLSPCDPTVQLCKPLQVFGVIFPTYCEILDSFGDGVSNALMIYLVGVETSQVIDENSTLLNITASSQTIPWASMMLCSPKYAIEKAQLSVDTQNPKLPGGTNISDPITESGNLIDGYHFSNLTEDLYGLVPFTGELPQPFGLSTTDSVDYSNVDGWFTLMMYASGATDILEFRDYAVMSSQSNKTFKGLISQWVGTWLTFPSNLSAPASYAYSEQRLHVHDTSFWGMVGALSLAVVFTVLILCLRNLSTLPWQADDMLSYISILQKSPELRDFCKNLGHTSDVQISHHLFGSKFGLITDSGHPLRIEPRLGPIAISTSAHLRDVGMGEQPRHWRPPGSKLWFAIIAISLPLAVIVSLEVLQRRSNANSGLADIKSSTSFSAALPTYIPALIMLITAAVFSTGEFAVCLFAPYLAMKTGSASLTQARANTLPQLAPVAIFRALCDRQFSMAILVFAAILGSILTIISSGLYSINAVTKVYATSVSTVDQFDLQWNQPVNVASETMFTLIQFHNASHPSGTYGEIALPLFSLNESDPTILSLLQSEYSNTIEIQIPIIRPSLNCSFVDPADMTIQVGNNGLRTNFSIQYPWADVTTLFSLPPHCQHSPGQFQNSTEVWLNSTTQLSPVDNSPVLAGELEFPTGSDQKGIDRLLTYAPGCPSVGLTFGKFAVGNTDVNDITRLICSQYQEEIPATMTFALPSLQLDLSKPPILHQSQAKVISRTSYDFVTLFGSQEYFSLIGPNETVSLDDFFLFLRGGRDGTPLANFVGVQNRERLLNATQHLYRLYMVQVINEAMRINVTNATTQNDAVTQMGTQLPAQIFDHGRLRVVQHSTSTRILQGVLAVMVLCWVLGFKTLRSTGEIVKQNPCTPMGGLTLLAGSRLVEHVAEVAAAEGGEMKDKELEKRIQGLRFHLGWWAVHGANDQRIDTAFGEADAASPKPDKRFGIDVLLDHQAAASVQDWRSKPEPR